MLAPPHGRVWRWVGVEESGRLPSVAVGVPVGAPRRLQEEGCRTPRKDVSLPSRPTRTAKEKRAKSAFDLEMSVPLIVNSAKSQRDQSPACMLRACVQRPADLAPAAATRSGPRKAFRESGVTLTEQLASPGCESRQAGEQRQGEGEGAGSRLASASPLWAER